VNYEKEDANLLVASVTSYDSVSSTFFLILLAFGGVVDETRADILIEDI